MVYHRVLEQIAAKAKIAFEPPIVLEANSPAKCAAICVTGSMGDMREWSIGEAAPGNNKNAYPYAMAEKRAKDRVVLKLIGLHGLAYSEDEADDFTPPAQQPVLEPSELAMSLRDELDTIASKTEIDAWTAKVKKMGEDNQLTSDDRLWLRGPYETKRAHIMQQKEAA